MASDPGASGPVYSSPWLNIPPPKQQQSSKLWILIPVGGALVLVLFLVKCGSSLSKANALSRASVEKFHAQLNREEYQLIFSLADAPFQSAAPREETIRFLRAVHTKLGNARESSFQNINLQATPNGTFIVAQYSTTFDKGLAIESFTWRLENDKTRLVGYNINSTKLVTE